jgi:hypothetical protein
MMLYPIYDIPHNGTNNYTFMGYHFEDSYQHPDPDRGWLLFHAVLHNPEAPNMTHSYHGYIRKLAGRWGGREWAAAWLIAHWHEHALNICGCQGHGRNADEDALKFRYEFIDKVMTEYGKSTNRPAGPAHSSLPAANPHHDGQEGWWGTEDRRSRHARLARR